MSGVISLALRPGQSSTPGGAGAPRCKGNGNVKDSGDRLSCAAIRADGPSCCLQRSARPHQPRWRSGISGAASIPRSGPCEDRAQRIFCGKYLHMGGCNCSSHEVCLGVPSAIAAAEVWCASEVPEAVWCYANGNRHAAALSSWFDAQQQPL